METQQQSSTLPTVSRGSGHSAEKSSPEAITAASVDNFSIPELPIGKVLVFNILTTWGDKYYVGLTGIEVFTASGEPAVITEVLTTINEIKRRGELTSIVLVTSYGHYSVQYILLSASSFLTYITRTSTRICFV